MLDNMPRGTICIEDIEIGMTRHLRKVVTDTDIEMFAQVSTDHNPVHLDDAYARDTIFEGRIAHGMLTADPVRAATAAHDCRPAGGHSPVQPAPETHHGRCRIWSGTKDLLQNRDH